MSIHVKNGTPVEGPPLCESCLNAHIQRGYKQSELLMLCTANYPILRVTFAVRECTSYVSKNRQKLRDMEEVAWVLAPRGPKRTAGFVAPVGSSAGVEEITFAPATVELPLDRE